MEPLQLWLDPDEYVALAARLEAERRAARELDARLLAERGLEEQLKLLAA